MFHSLTALSLFKSVPIGFYRQKLLSDDETNAYKLSRDCKKVFLLHWSWRKNCLVLSDGLIELQGLLHTIAQIQTKNKIAIIDSCHSGGRHLRGFRR